MYQLLIKVLFAYICDTLLNRSNSFLILAQIRHYLYYKRVMGYSINFVIGCYYLFLAASRNFSRVNFVIPCNNIAMLQSSLIHGLANAKIVFQFEPVVAETSSLYINYPELRKQCVYPSITFRNLYYANILYF